MRPPYARAEIDFRKLCDGCDACRESCPTGVIGKDGDGIPMLLYGQAVCDFCGACADACPTGAMVREQARPWIVTAHVKATCLSFNAVTCRCCEESCEAGAIRFRLMTGGRALPQIDDDACTGCGHCAVICPNNSVEMRSRAREEAFA